MKLFAVIYSYKFSDILRLCKSFCNLTRKKSSGSHALFPCQLLEWIASFDVHSARAVWLTFYCPQAIAISAVFFSASGKENSKVRWLRYLGRIDRCCIILVSTSGCNTPSIFWLTSFVWKAKTRLPLFLPPSIVLQEYYSEFIAKREGAMVPDVLKFFLF